MNEFLVRTPIFSLEILNEFYTNSEPEEFIFSVFSENELFRESIYLYSTSLHMQVLRYINETDNKYIKKKSKVADSLIKYFLRMCYRATPFGLAAGISMAQFSNGSEKNTVNYISRSVKIDSGVFSNIIQRVNSLGAVRSTITYRTNNTLYEKNRYYRYIERKNLTKSFDFVLSKVEQTEFLDEVLNLGHSGISLSVVKKLLIDQENLSDGDIEDFFYGLIDSQLIISELQYNVLNPGFQRAFVKHLKSILSSQSDEELAQIILILEKVFSFSDDLKSIPLENSNSLMIIQKIDELLKPYNNENKTTVQIDLINDSDCRLPWKIKETIEQNLFNFSKINAQVNSENNDLKNFRKCFMNRYGHKTIPLLEVLDADIGIGYPVKLSVKGNTTLLDNINIQMFVDEKMKFTKWDSFLLEKYVRCLADNKKIIEITENDLELFSVSGNNKIKDSLIFTGQVIRTKDDDFKYHFNSIKVGAAHFIIGRFAYGSKKIEKLCKTIAHFETEVLSKNQVLTELLHFSQPKLGNITSRHNFYNNHIPIIDVADNNKERSISLSDLYLNISEDRLVLYSKKLNKQVIPRLGCAQNTELLTNPIYKFLGAISEVYYLRTWDWGAFYFRPYLPRVEFNKFILSKERWMLDVDHVFGSGKKDFSILNEYILKKKINQRVTMSLGGDNLLPLDLQNTKSIELLFKELMGGKPVILEECLFSPLSNPVITNKTGGTTNEICVPFLLDGITQEKNSNLNIERIKSAISDSKILSKTKSFPFLESIYIKVYVKTGIDIDKIFMNKFLQLVNILEAHKLYENFFFIRYLDPDYHFRLRFFGSRSKFPNIIEFFNKVFETEMDDLLIDKIQIDTYERETERYGGEVGMMISEEMFYHDSVCVLQILAWVQNHKKENELWLIAMVGVHQMLNDFSLKNSERISTLKEVRDYYFSLISNKKEAKIEMSKFFRKNRNKIERNINLDYFEAQYFDYYKSRSIHNKKIINELISKEIDYDVKNYIHMFLNRLFDFNQNLQETIVYDLLIQHYKSLKFKK